MNQKRPGIGIAKVLVLFAALYLAAALVFYWIVADSWTMASVHTDTVNMGRLLPANSVVSQSFVSNMDRLESLSLVPHFDSAPAGTVHLTLSDGEQLLYEADADISAWSTDNPVHYPLSSPLEGVMGKTLTFAVDPQDTQMALWIGNTMSAGKFDLTVETQGLLVNGEPADGELVLEATGCKFLSGIAFFWPVAILLMVCCLAAIWLVYQQLLTGKNTIMAKLVNVCKQYHYLLKVLIWRDFSVKYMSSSLGMLWSLFNPLLTMGVYLVVFSTLFTSNIEYFPVYLMSGIVLMNAFGEATNLGLQSIVGNSALITKVYMPKVIYPLSKVMSSTINLCLSIIPLLLVMLITGVPFTKSLLLLPLAVLFLLAFSLGVGLILAAMNVFFRDIQFLWSVVLTMLNFLSPVFYPESIIPANLLPIYRLNPMYQIMHFMRAIVIGGAAPTPDAFLGCILTAGISLAVGLWFFRKNQDKFVLYL